MIANNVLRSKLKLRHVQIVVAIAEMGNLLRAAQSLSITQPAISKALFDIEELIGQRLFERTPFGTRPTRAGEVIVQYGRNILVDMGRMHDALDASKFGELKELRVGIYSLISEWNPIACALARMKSASTWLSLVVEEAPMEDLAARMETGALDVIVGRSPYTNQQSNQQNTISSIVPDRIVAIVRLGHPVLGLGQITSEDLISWPWVLPPERNLVRMQMEMHLAEADLALVDVPVTSLAMHVNVQLIKSTDCVMFMSENVAADRARVGDIAIVPFALPVTPGVLMAMWRSERTVNRLIDRFVEILKDEAQKDRPGTRESCCTEPDSETLFSVTTEERSSATG